MGRDKAKLLVLSLFLLLPTVILAADEESAFETEIDNFDGGVDTAHLPDRLRTSNLQGCLNFLSDKKYGLTRREGATNNAGCLNTSTLNLWRYTGPSGTEYLIRLDCRGNLIAGSQIRSGDQCFSQCVSTNLVTTSVPTDSTECLGKVWFTNRTNGLSSWDETTYVTYANAPKASRIACFKNRIALGDITNEQSSIRLSGELAGNDWNNDSRFSTSPVSIRVGGVNDGNKVHWVHAGIDELVIGKAFSLYSLIGNDQRDFRLRVISPEIGSIYPRTVQQRAEKMLFISNRGLDAYTPPYTFEKVGENIQDQLNALSALTARGGIFSFDTQGQWETGTSVPTGNISTTFVAGAIMPPNQQFIDTTKANFDTGVSSSAGASTLSTSQVDGSLTFTSTAQAYVNNGSFETADGGIPSGAQHWTLTESNNCDGIASNGLLRSGVGGAPDGSFFMLSACGYTRADGLILGNTAQFVVFDMNDNLLLVKPLNIGISTVTTLGGADSWVGTSIDVSAYRGRQLKVGVRQRMDGPVSRLEQSTITVTMFVDSNLYVVAKSSNNVPTLGTRFTTNLGVDLFQTSMRPSSDFTANFLSQTFDTLVSSPHYSQFRADVKFGTVTFGVQTATSNSPANCCWGSFVSTTNANMSSLNGKFVRYAATFSVSDTSSNSFTTRIDSVTLGSYVTGYFQTSVADVGSDITSWGLYTAAQSENGGGISHQVQSSNDGTLTEGGWISQSVDVAIVAPVRRYIASRVFFSATAATNTPSVDSLSYNWNEGEDPPDPLGLTYKETYYLFYSTAVTSGQNNDKIAAFNRNNAIDIYGGLEVGGATVFGNTILIGDANETGRVYSMFTSTDGTDYGNSVQSYIKLRRLDAGKPDALKIFDKVYLTISRDNTSVSQIFKLEYFIDGATTVYSSANIEISTGVKMTTLKSEIPKEIGVENTGHYLDIKISEHTQKTFPYNIHRIKLYGTIKKVE